MAKCKDFEEIVGGITQAPAVEAEAKAPGFITDQGTQTGELLRERSMGHKLGADELVLRSAGVLKDQSPTTVNVGMVLAKVAQRRWLRRPDREAWE